jgi:hypothetical protein
VCLTAPLSFVSSPILGERDTRGHCGLNDRRSTMMPAEAFEQCLRGLLGREPFQPFVIELDTGERFRVESKKSVLYREGGTALYFHPDDDMDFVHCDGVRRFIEPAEKASA